MGNKSAVMLQPEEVASVAKETGFSEMQIRRLFYRFQSLDKGDNGVLSREDFLRIPELTINPLGERIVQAFIGDEESINFRQFINVLSKFRPTRKLARTNEDLPNSRTSKALFAFNMYDIERNGKITSRDLLAVLHMLVGSNISEDQLQNIAERTISEADQGGNGSISFSDFCKSLERVDIEQKLSIRFLN